MNDLCMFCFRVKGQYEVCPYCGHVEGTPPLQPYHLMPGTILGEHFITGPVIGEGGFGITYRCYDQMLGVVVAIKEFYPAGMVTRSAGEQQVRLLFGRQAAHYRAHLKRFMTEAQSIARFGKAKDIVNVYDYFEANGTAYIVMEYLEGTLLKKYLEDRGKVECDAAVNIMLSLTGAIKKIHAEGIVHRDISPDNIFISDDASIKLFDFGSAYFMEDTGDIKVDIIVKEGYSAPELYRKDGKQGYVSDVYSAGAILYQLITGIKPQAASKREIHDELQSPMALGITIEPNLDRTIMEALAVSPELRIQSIMQFEESLNNRRMAEYPEQKAKKKKNAKLLKTGLLAAAVMVTGVAVVLGITLFKPENPMFHDSIEKGTKITIWVDDEETKEDLEMIAGMGSSSSNAGGEFTNMGKGTDEKTKKVVTDNKNVAEITVAVKENLPEELEKVKNTKDMPDMFISDQVDLSRFDVVNLKENVYEALDQEKYYFLSEECYKNYFPDADRMPTRLDTLLYYAYDVENSEKEGHKSRYLESADQTEIIDAEDLLNEKEEIFSVRQPYQNYLTLLFLPAGYQTNGIVLKDSKFSSILQQIYEEKERKAKAEWQGPLETYGKGMVAGMGERSSLPGYNDIDENNHSRLRETKIFLLGLKNKFQMRYTNCFSISAKSGKSEQLACERFLWTLLGRAAQTNYGAEGDAATEMPIRKEACENYFEYSGIPKVVLKQLEHEENWYLLGDYIMIQETD